MSLRLRPFGVPNRGRPFVTALAIACATVACGSDGSETDGAPHSDPAPTTAATTAPETTSATETSTTVSAPTATDIETDALDLTQLWSYGLTSIRTGEPLVTEEGEHRIDPAVVSYGNNLVMDAQGNVLSARAVPLHGGEQLVLTDDGPADHNTREYARIVSLMAPIRDAILYRFEQTSRDEWTALTQVLTFNGIKVIDAPEVNGRSVLSTTQVYDYVASGTAEGSPVMRYLEEAELELKCLAFVDFDFTNPEGADHCVDHDIDTGSGIVLP